MVLYRRRDYEPLRLRALSPPADCFVRGGPRRRFRGSTPCFARGARPDCWMSRTATRDFHFWFLKLTGAVFGNSPRFTRGLSPIAAPFELDRWSGLSERVTMSARSPLCWYERVLRSGKHTHRCSSAPSSRVAGVTGASHVRTLLSFIGRRWVAPFDIADSVCGLGPIGGPIVLRKHARGTSCDPRTPE